MEKGKALRSINVSIHDTTTSSSCSRVNVLFPLNYVCAEFDTVLDWYLTHVQLFCQNTSMTMARPFLFAFARAGRRAGLEAEAEAHQRTAPSRGPPPGFGSHSGKSNTGMQTNGKNTARAKEYRIENKIRYKRKYLRDNLKIRQQPENHKTCKQ